MSIIVIKKYAAFLSLAALIIFFMFRASPAPDFNEIKEILTLNQIKKVFPSAERAEKEAKTALRVYDRQNNFLGYALTSEHYGEAIRGFAGLVPVIIALDADKKITEVKISENNETPGYIKRVENSGLLEKWRGFSAEEALSIKTDAVTGATFSSLAVIRGLRLSLEDFSYVPPTFEEKLITQITLLFKDIKFIFTVFILTAGILIAFNFFNFKKNKLMLSVFTIIIIGFWFNALPNLKIIFNLISGRTALTGLFALFLITLFAVLIPFFTNKRFYCGYICPYGMLQELAAKIPSKKIKFKKSVYKYLRTLRKFIFIFMVIALVYNFNVIKFHPFGLFNYKHFAAAGFIAGVIFIILSVFSPRFWCLFLCPEGEFFDLFKGKKKPRKSAGGIKEK